MADTVWCEYETVGAILIHGRKCLHQVIDILKPEYFTVYELSEAYREMLKMDAESKEITSGSLIGSLSGRLTPEMKVEIARAAKSVCSASVIRHNAKSIVDSWKMAQAMKVAAAFGQDEYEDTSKYIAMYADMLNAVAGFGDEAGVKSWRDVCARAKREMFSPVSEKRIFFGLPGFDRILGGSDPTDLVLIAARPAVGKTAFKEQFVRNLARKGKKILNVSLEMPDIQLAERQTSALSGISLSDIRNRVIVSGPGYDVEKEKIETAIDDMWDWDIDVYDTPNMTPNHLSRIVRLEKYDIAVIDYGGLMNADSRTQNRQEEMAAVSRGLRAIALGQKIQVIVLLQLNREVEHRASNRVLLSDLKETGQWEQDAVQVIGMSQYGEPEENKVLLEVLKNRNGECGTMILQFDKPRMRFYELEERYEEPKQKRARGMD